MALSEVEGLKALSEVEGLKRGAYIAASLPGRARVHSSQDVGNDKGSRPRLLPDDLTG